MALIIKLTLLSYFLKTKNVQIICCWAIRSSIYKDVRWVSRRNLSQAIAASLQIPMCTMGKFVTSNISHIITCYIVISPPLKVIYIQLWFIYSIMFYIDLYILSWYYILYLTLSGVCYIHQLPCITTELTSFNINGVTITTPPGQHCKKKNIIYLGQCQLCLEKLENTYAGKSMQKFSNRVNGHRSHFKPGDLDSIDKSAFSLHAHEEHQDNFDLNNYKLMIYKSTNNPRNLHRLESVVIGGLRTNILGLNRMNTQK